MLMFMGDLRSALEAQIEQVEARPAVVALCRAIADHLDSRVCDECGAGLMDDKILREYRLALGLLLSQVQEGGESAADRLEREFADLDPTVGD